MNHKITLSISLIVISAVMSFAAEINFKPSNLDFGYSPSFNLQNNVQRYRSDFGKVASDREAITNNTFKTFVNFRNAAIGVIVPGTLFGSGAAIATIALFYVSLNTVANGMTDWGEALAALSATPGFLPGMYACLAFGVISALLLCAGIAFSVCAGAFYYKWTKERGVTTYNSLSSDKPQFAQGFSIAL